ncbi:MAG: ABC transporter ATP-binding protein [Bryobacterales bacterium]|nr:ABC transporter ATP-binding protein [Bryobacterales bacterium]
MLQASNVSKTYDSPAGPLLILDRVSLDLSSGQSLSIMGPSGCGKSTLLNILGVLDVPSSGAVRVNGVEPHKLNAAQQAAFRNQHIGFVFQDHCLLPQLSVLENVLTPVLVGQPDAQAPARARRLLEEVGLSARLDHRPGQLSGGERQRVAIARALIRQPTLLLCDEPTGNLDHRSGTAVCDLLASLLTEHQTIMIIVTHSPEMARRFGDVLRLEDGRLCASSI